MPRAKGRPDKIEYWLKNDGMMQIISWARRGLTYKEIAENMNISEYSLLKWRKQNKAIEEATNGREMAICEVENAMYRLALGYMYTEQVVTNKGEVVEVTRYQHPSLAAQIFFLKNRLPEYWKDKREIKHIDSGGQKVVVKWGENNGSGATPVLPPSSSKGDA